MSAAPDKMFITNLNGCEPLQVTKEQQAELFRAARQYYTDGNDAAFEKAVRAVLGDEFCDANLHRDVIFSLKVVDAKADKWNN